MPYAISGVVGLIAGLLCYRRIYKNGRSRKQRRAERWEALGGVAEGISTSAEQMRAGASGSEAEAPRDAYYRSRYHYCVRGRTYTAWLHSLDEYPTRITVYYNPEKPGEHIVANEISEASRRGRGCLISILLTMLSIGVSGNLIKLLMR